MERYRSYGMKGLYGGLMEERKRPCHLLFDGCSIEEAINLFINHLAGISMGVYYGTINLKNWR